MKVLIVGGGGREHALAWSIAGSPLLERLWCAPGNAGIAREAECVGISASDIDGLVKFARDEGIDFVVVGPEAPLVAGLVDRLEAQRIRAFGPSAQAAMLEASKGFTKDLCARAGIPSGAYRRFAEPEAAKRFVRELGSPVVVKADGLASGKGVVIAENVNEADRAIDDMLVRARFGAAGAEIVVEEFLRGEEASFFALVDGENAVPLATAQDHKRVGDGDTGPNTGGMGAYSPAPCVTPVIAERVMAEIIKPTVAAMREAGRPYRGVLYAGLMLTADGPKLLEYNVRFGDPECQVLVPRLMSDLLTALIAARDGELAHFDLRWHADAALTVVMAARGYPGEVARGSEIRGLADAEKVEGVTIFHAGTRADGNRLLADGGRVLGVTALGRTIKEAQSRAYTAVDRVDWPEGFCRRDIGWRAV
jgi:phosphoribosylamine--glycine ligase